jgi:hypothetical protein
MRFFLLKFFFFKKKKTFDFQQGVYWALTAVDLAQVVEARRIIFQMYSQLGSTAITYLPRYLYTEVS